MTFDVWERSDSKLRRYTLLKTKQTQLQAANAPNGEVTLGSFNASIIEVYALTDSFFPYVMNPASRLDMITSCD